MQKRDLLRLKPMYIIMGLVIFFLFSILGYTNYVKASLDNKITEKQSEEVKAKESYEKTTYIENNIEQFYNFVNEVKSFGSISMQSLKREFSFLIPNIVVFTNIELEGNIGKIDGKTVDHRTVDLLVSTLNSYSKLYGKIYNIKLESSSQNSPTNVVFSLSFEINTEEMMEKIYTSDMDGDGIIDYREEMVEVSPGVSAMKKIINDECPFSQGEYVIIGKILEENPLLIDFYASYKKMYDEGYFSLNENGCLMKGDFNILERGF